MSDIIPLPKSANKWDDNNLMHLKIERVKITVNDFMQNSPLPDIPAYLLDYVDPHLQDRKTVENYALYACLQELHDAEDPDYYETAVDLFALRFLEMIHFTERPALMKMNYHLIFHYGATICHGDPNLAAVGDSELISGFYQENKTRQDGGVHVHAQLIAEGITAFEHNTDILATAGKPLCNLMRFLAMTMVGTTTPTFYIVNITAALVKAINDDAEPSDTTLVYYCCPDSENLGMEPVGNRR